MNPVVVWSSSASESVGKCGCAPIKQAREIREECSWSKMTRSGKSGEWNGVVEEISTTADQHCSVSSTSTSLNKLSSTLRTVIYSYTVVGQACQISRGRVGLLGGDHRKLKSKPGAGDLPTSRP